MGCVVSVNESLCKECGICVELCPVGVLKLVDIAVGKHVPNLVGRCVGCLMCQRFCPDFAIWVKCGDGS